jgi:hypothetical protein
MKRILALGVAVDAPAETALLYATRLAMRPVSAQGMTVVMAGSLEPPWLALIDRQGLAAAAIPRGRGVRILTCASDRLDADACWLRERGWPYEEIPVHLAGRAQRRLVTVSTALGLRLELVDAPDPPDRAIDLALASASGSDGEHGDTALANRLDGQGPVATAVAGAPLDHVAMPVLDIAGALAAVEGLLECRLFDEFPVTHDAGRTTVRLLAQAPPDGFYLTIGDAGNLAAHHPFRRQIAERGGPGVHHVAHRVDGLERAIDAVCGAGGVTLGQVEQASGLRQIFVSIGEDGIVHELVERKGVAGFVQRNTAALVQTEGQWKTSIG